MSSGGLFWTNFDSPISFDRSETKESLLREPSDDSIVDDAIVAHRRCVFFLVCGNRCGEVVCLSKVLFIKLLWVEWSVTSCNDVLRN